MSEGDDLFWPITVVVVLALLAIGAWLAVRNYDECRAVPHTAVYCLTSGS